MANKISLNHQNDEDYYEPSDSEDEYTKREKELLKKARKSKKSEESEQEVLGFDESESDGNVADDNYASDDEYNEKFEADSDFDENESHNIPDARAWGSSRKDFFNADFVDPDYSSYNTEQEQLAEEEENEARLIQQRLAKQLNEADFSLNVYSTEVKPSMAKEDRKTLLLEKDLSDLSQREKIRLFKKDSPEFAGLVDDFEQRLCESRDSLQPALDWFQANGIVLPIVDFVRTKNELCLTYCSNIAFYLVLKAKRMSIKNHPIVKRLVQMRQILLQLDEKAEQSISGQLSRLVTAIADGDEVNVSADTTDDQMKVKKSKKLLILDAIAKKYIQSDSESDAEMKEDEKVEEKINTTMSVIDNDTINDVDDEDEEETMRNGDDRREITYEIAKNKGLTPHRKKELRNPRVKHRGKYRKALIRRKGAVRTVRKEVKRYGGEISGIKATTKKGIKIK